ncbi:signal peptidase II [Candidatus Woesearchaeota archaeon]|nr:signal peptidase II [Candidatus Woesearchaeota archaeon]
MIKFDKFTLTSLGLILIDQISKFLLESSKNYGAAFGILQGWKLLFVIVGFFVIGFILYYKDKIKGYGYYGLILLFSGTIGNLVDRIVFGYVKDFIDLGFWPSFNLADSFNTVGVILLIIYFWKN